MARPARADWKSRTGLRDSSPHLPWRSPLSHAPAGAATGQSESSAEREALERALAEQARQRDQTAPRLLSIGTAPRSMPVQTAPDASAAAPRAPAATGQRPSAAARREATVPVIRAAAHSPLGQPDAPVASAAGTAAIPAAIEATGATGVDGATEVSGPSPEWPAAVDPPAARMASQPESLPSILRAPQEPSAAEGRRALPEELPGPMPLIQQPMGQPPADSAAPSPSDRPDAFELPELQFDQPLGDGTVNRPELAEFNGRDCAEEAQNCEATFESLADRPMKTLSIDITPELSVNPLEPKVEQARVEELLREIPWRVWRSAAGDELAEGYLRDYREGKAVIVDRQGKLVARIPVIQLGDEERCFVAAWWGLPVDCRLPEGPSPQRNWEMTTFTWTSPALHHKPLYFEEPQLERYGHTAHPLVQPFVSMVHFFGNAATLPYHMGVHPPNECRYELGYYRPGDCAPWLISPIPLHARGARLQAAALVGLAALIP